MGPSGGQALPFRRWPPAPLAEKPFSTLLPSLLGPVFTSTPHPTPTSPNCHRPFISAASHRGSALGWLAYVLVTAAGCTEWWNTRSRWPASQVRGPRTRCLVLGAGTGLAIFSETPLCTPCPVNTLSPSLSPSLLYPAGLHVLEFPATSVLSPLFLGCPTRIPRLGHGSGL